MKKALAIGVSPSGQITRCTNMDYEKLNKQATRALYELIKDIPGVSILEYDDGIEFEYDGHKFYFTSEVAE